MVILFYTNVKEFFNMGLGNMEDFTIDQFAGATALVLGSVGGLLMIIWKSRCECEMNLCYIWRCHRKPPPEQTKEDSDDDEEKNKLRRSPRLAEKEKERLESLTPNSFSP